MIIEMDGDKWYDGVHYGAGWVVDVWDTNSAFEAMQNIYDELQDFVYSKHSHLELHIRTNSLPKKEAKVYETESDAWFCFSIMGDVIEALYETGELNIVIKYPDGKL